jgi:hypothetical protein
VPNGVVGSRDAVLGAYVRRLEHGKQVGQPHSATRSFPGTPTLVVKATAGGRPIANAVVSLLERQDGAATWIATRAITTGADGTASVRPAAGPSRDVRFAYVPDSESASFISSASIAMRIKPRATLNVRPRSLHTGQRVGFTGKVTGGPIPPQGLALSLQATGLGGRWLTFKTVRAGSDGRFRAAYRFTATTGHVRYRFRIRVLRQGGYPFATAYSKPVSVLVQG